MTAPPVLFADDTNFIVKVSDTNLQPDYQAGDHVTVRQQKTAEPGDVVVALVDGDARLLRWPVEKAQVLGVVTAMFRSLA